MGYQYLPRNNYRRFHQLGVDSAGRPPYHLANTMRLSFFHATQATLPPRRTRAQAPWTSNQHVVMGCGKRKPNATKTELGPPLPQTLTSAHVGPSSSSFHLPSSILSSSAPLLAQCRSRCSRAHRARPIGDGSLLGLSEATEVPEMQCIFASRLERADANARTLKRIALSLEPKWT